MGFFREMDYITPSGQKKKKKNFGIPYREPKQAPTPREYFRDPSRRDLFVAPNVVVVAIVYQKLWISENKGRENRGFTLH